MIEIKNNGVTVVEPRDISESTNVSFTVLLPVGCVQKCNLEIIRSKFDGFTEQLLNLEELWIDDINVSELCHGSKYYPIYPEPWFTEQKDQGTTWPEFLQAVTSWGWNGRWTLEYETPIYTWLLKNV